MPDITLSKTQTSAWKYLMDSTTNEVLFGGGLAGGKSFIGCLWIVTQCIKYAGTRHIIGRTVLHTLKQTTLVTLFQVLKKMGLLPEKHYVFNGQTNIIKFYNESEIILKNLEYSPQDPNYESLQGYEVSSIMVDEGSQITETCYNVLKSRIRFKLNDYNLIPKILITANPGNNYLKKLFYIPYTQDILEPNKKYVQSLITDNPHVNKAYVQSLSSLPSEQRKRLLLGSWDYTSDINVIFDFENITSSMYRFAPNPNDKKILSCDISRFGEDRSVIVLWVGLVITEIFIFRKLSTVQLSNEIMVLMKSYGIHPSNVIVDTDGIGAGVGDQIRGLNFVNNSKPLHGQNFTNLKSQCYLKLSEMFNQKLISININHPETLDDLTQELLAVKLKDVDKDGKVGVISKDEQKKILNRSPDISDALMMGMYPHIKTLKSTGRYAIAII